METCALLYWQTQGTLSDRVQKEMDGFVRTWMVDMIGRGWFIETRLFEDENFVAVSKDGRSGSIYPKGAKLLGITFIDVRDLEEAIAIAEEHPLRRCGAHIDVRRWSPYKAFP
jgi:hypothetical protein